MNIRIRFYLFNGFSSIVEIRNNRKVDFHRTLDSSSESDLLNATAIPNFKHPEGIRSVLKSALP